ncbi:MAG: hydrogenase formation protein HypD [Candidatus Omnitrophota bacterium]
MKYIDEFRNLKLARKISAGIKTLMPQEDIRIMEVCGTHTQSFFRFGLSGLLPARLKLISGPGCPVCVSPQEYIDRAISIAGVKDTLVLTFGDMLRVPGTRSSLENERWKSGNPRVVYSPWESLNTAQRNPDKRVVFLAVGFETTAPAIALTILAAQKQKLKNLSFFCALKAIPPAMQFLLADKRLKINAFLCPGHVSAIIGTRPYEFIARRYKVGCCVAGFEPLDILEGIYFLLLQIKSKRAKVVNQYARLVRPEGNPKAKAAISAVFQKCPAVWRGLGEIPQSGLKIKKTFSRFDTEKVFALKPIAQGAAKKSRCLCGDVLKGLVTPRDCPLFGKACNPGHPFGPCMVTHEGACNAYFKYS